MQELKAIQTCYTIRIELMRVYNHSKHQIITSKSINQVFEVFWSSKLFKQVNKVLQEL